ncbi:MAG: hypothetical protein SFU91_07650 [Chloroherpetonaceae bacterium]|nr:hypothetical protein [Chloroherpetonaceae bacterium]
MKRQIVHSVLKHTFIFLVFALSLSSCKENGLETAGVEEADAADAVAASLGDGDATNGLAAQMSDAVILSEPASSETLKSIEIPSVEFSNFDTTISKVKNTGTRTYNYQFSYAYALNTPPTSATFTYSMKGTYDLPRVSSNDSANASLTIGGILPTATAFSVNGTYTRNGSQTSKVRQKAVFTSTISLTVSNLQVSRATKRILSGTASGTIAVALSTGSSATYTVSITFLGNQAATVVVNGKSYSVNLTNGETAE